MIKKTGRLLFFLLFPILSMGQSVDGSLKTITVTTSSSNVYAFSEALPAAYDPKERFILIFQNGNSGSITINRATLGAKTVKKLSSGALANLASGDIVAGVRYLMGYDGTNYQCFTCGSSGGGGGGWATSGSTSVTTPTIVGSPTFDLGNGGANYGLVTFNHGALYLTGARGGDFAIYNDASYNTSQAVGHFAGDFATFQGTAGSAYSSFRAGVTYNSTINRNHYAGIDIGFTFAGAGTLDDVFGFYDLPSVSGGGTVTRRAGVHVKEMAVSGGSTLTTQYGVRVDNLTTGGTNWSIYTGTAPSWFNGKILVGSMGVSTVPNASIQISNQATGVYPDGDAGVLVSRSMATTASPTVGHGFADVSLMTTNTGSYAAFDSRVNFASGNAFDHFVGFQDRPTFSGITSLSYTYSLYSAPVFSSGGTTTNRFGTFIDDVGVSGGSIVTNNYGHYIPNLTGGVNNWSLYTGTASNYFGGSTYEGQNGANATNNASQGSSYDLSFKQSLWTGAAETKGWFSLRATPSSHSQSNNHALQLYESVGATSSFSTPIVYMEAYDAQDTKGKYYFGRSGVNNDFGLQVSSSDNTIGFINSGFSQLAGLKLNGNTGLLTLYNTAGGGGLSIDGNLTLATAGNKIVITEGSNGRVGQTVLVSGTKAITITGLTTSSRAFLELVSPTGVTLTTQYQAVCTSNTLTLQANVAAGTINTADGSTLNYIVYN